MGKKLLIRSNITPSVSISGTLTDGVNALPDIKVVFGSYFAYTDYYGNFTISGIPDDTTESLMPVKSGYLFEPELIELTVSLDAPVMVGYNFTVYHMLFYDAFTTSEDAPITSPRTCEPIGALTVTDAGNILSISGGNLLVNGTASGATGCIGDEFARVAGRTMGTWFNAVTANGLNRTGWGKSLTSLTYYIGGNSTINNSPGLLVSTPPPHSQTIALRTTGAFYIINGYLNWVSNIDSTNLKPVIYVVAGQSPNLSIGDVRVLDIAKLSDESNVYTYFDATPAANDTATMTADALIQFTWTPAENEVLTIMFRRTDDDNTLKLVLDQANSTTKTISRASGADTEIASGADTWAIGTAYPLTINASGTSIKAYTGTTAINESSTSAQLTATGVKVSGFANGADFYCWKRDLISLLPQFLFPETPKRYYLIIGDSKSANKCWAQYFEPLCATPAASWHLVGLWAGAGRSLQAEKNLIDSQLASVADSPEPEFMMLNLGTNDMSGDSNDIFYYDPDQDGDVWQSNLAYVLDAVHAKFPDCQCYVMRHWRPNVGDADYTAKITLMDDVLIPAVVSTREWAHLGLDERIYLENGDDGVTYLLPDRLHPNTAGHRLTAQLWKDEVGL